MCWRGGHELGRTLIAKYSQGFINPPPLVRKDVTAIGYSAEWLNETDYHGRTHRL